MIEQGVLKHDPANSYSREDRALSLKDGTSVTLNENKLINNTIDEDAYTIIRTRISQRGQDCINNNTHHPSAEVCKNTKAPGEAVQMGVKLCVLGTVGICLNLEEIHFDNYWVKRRSYYG